MLKVNRKLSHLLLSLLRLGLVLASLVLSVCSRDSNCLSRNIRGRGSFDDRNRASVDRLTQGLLFAGRGDRRPKCYVGTKVLTNKRDYILIPSRLNLSLKTVSKRLLGPAMRKNDRISKSRVK